MIRGRVRLTTNSRTLLSHSGETSRSPLTVQRYGVRQANFTCLIPEESIMNGWSQDVSEVVERHSGMKCRNP